METTDTLSESEEEVIFNPFEAYLNIGRHLVCRNDFKRALFYLDKAQGIEPKNVECLLMRATCHLFLTNNDETIELAKAAHEITKRNPHAILLIAEGYYRKGDFEMALKYFINGKRMRSSIEAFTSGVHKCEQAIKNNCGNDVDPKLWPEMDLTDYYSYAFPPKNTSNSFTLDARKATVGEKGTADKKLTEKWPEMMPAETLRKVFGKKYSEYLYIHEMYRVEGKRAEFLKHMEMSHLDDLCARIDRCKQNRKIVRDCAYCLQAKTDLWHKIDPSMKHTTPL
ncbi:outer arm dynein binding protein [Echinococcus multilocularis]|uniref:Outer dynein arm-docking complex subunit 4 n=1 Tax=Echinococcus multilocularis TaxID=6211 RepID=A0A068Y1B2_ECHMU|nr:outer arm dynein binding protein [Echinococcus multilocularis]